LRKARRRKWPVFGAGMPGIALVDSGVMSDMKPMRERTLEFGEAVIREYRRQKAADEAEQILWLELLKTQKALATNSAESDGAQSRKDFAQKFQISLKESRECFQLIRLLGRITPARRQQLGALLKQCDEIIAILVTSLKTARRRQCSDDHRRRP
jgi:four helix bundle protein